MVTCVMADGDLMMRVAGTIFVPKTKHAGARTAAGTSLCRGSRSVSRMNVAPVQIFLT